MINAVYLQNTHAFAGVLSVAQKNPALAGL